MPETGPTVDRAGTLADLNGFATDADVVVIACPLNDQTRGAVGEAFFNAVKPGAILVNIARGPIVDDAAFLRTGVSHALLLAWNYAPFFLENAEFIKQGGKFIIPLPTPEIRP